MDLEKDSFLYRYSGDFDLISLKSLMSKGSVGNDIENYIRIFSYAVFIEFIYTINLSI